MVGSASPMIPPHGPQQQGPKMHGPPTHQPPPPPLSASLAGSNGSEKKRLGHNGMGSIDGRQQQQMATTPESPQICSVKQRAQLFSQGKNPMVPPLEHAPPPPGQLVTSILVGDNSGNSTNGGHHNNEQHAQMEKGGGSVGSATNGNRDLHRGKSALTTASSLASSTYPEQSLHLHNHQYHRDCSNKTGGSRGEGASNRSGINDEEEEEDEGGYDEVAKLGDGDATATPQKLGEFPPKPKDIPILQLDGHVGFDQFPYQYVEKCRAQGFHFNVLLVGPTGIGKTTLAETLFDISLSDFEPCNSELKSVELREKSIEVMEANVKVRLRIVETAGFGDQLDKEQSVKVLVDYINQQYEAYLKEELKVRRNLANYDDTRVHVCLYFISPTGHGLKALDVAALRKLSRCVNVIPIIAKADTTSPEELARFKHKVMAELTAEKIDIYTFSTDDEVVANDNAYLNTLRPFSVIGSSEIIEQEGKRFRARRYPWGVVEVKNEKYCDFVKLREAMLLHNEDELREFTYKVHYEHYRQERLREMGMQDGDAGANMLEAYEEQRRAMEEEHNRELKREDQDFRRRVERKEAELRNREEALNIRRREMTQHFDEEMAVLEGEAQELFAEKARRQRGSAGGDAAHRNNGGSLFGGKRHKHK